MKKRAMIWILCLLMPASGCGYGNQETTSVTIPSSTVTESTPQTTEQTTSQTTQATTSKTTSMSTSATTTVSETTTSKARTEATTTPDFETMSELERHRWEREQIKNDENRVFLYDNDGCDIVYEVGEVSIAGALAPRFTPLKDTAVDAVFYTPWSSGFHMYTHDTQVAQVFDCLESNFSSNKAGAFIEAGIDFFEAMVEFCHEQGMEIFFGMRMNDTHDNQGGWYGDIMFAYNEFKVNHPEYLIGKKGENPVYGNWTAVDFTHDIIRDMVVEVLEEACQRYNIDGIHLDFWRHPLFFKDAAEGRPLTQDTLDLMTDMMRAIRSMTEREGMKRERPILVSVRVPDCVEFSRAIGLDIEQWMREDLIDFLCITSYTQFNDWSYSVELGRRYNVRVYPSIDETRVRNEHANRARMAVETYFARLTNVFDAGADGFLLFNFGSYTSPIFRVGDDPKRFSRQKKHYFASYRGVGYFSRTWPHREFLNIPTVNPFDSLIVLREKSEKIVFRIGEDLETAKKEGRLPTIYLMITVQGVQKRDKITVAFNGESLDINPGMPSMLIFPLSHDQVIRGMNTLEIGLLEEGDAFIVVKDVMVSFTY